MKDRVKINNGKSSTLLCPSTYAPADFAAFLVDLKAGNVYVDITANNTTGSNAGVSQIGTALNKANLLSDATATRLGYEATDDPSVNDALDTILDEIDSLVSTETVSLNASDWTAATNTSGDTYYYQTKAVTGMTASLQYSLGVVLANPAANDSKTVRDNAVTGYNDWAYDGWFECSAGSITFKTYIQPTYNFDLVLVGV